MIDRLKVQEAVSLIRGAGCEITFSHGRAHMLDVGVEDLCLLLEPDGVQKLLARCEGVTLEQFREWENYYADGVPQCTGRCTNGKQCRNFVTDVAYSASHYIKGFSDRCIRHKDPEVIAVLIKKDTAPASFSLRHRISAACARLKAEGKL